VQRTLKRELKELEIVEREAIGGSEGRFKKKREKKAFFFNEQKKLFIKLKNDCPLTFFLSKKVANGIKIVQ